MNKEQKTRVVRLFLQFVNTYVPLKKAVIASLGGKGHEARLWQEMGVQPQNGWLIERKKKESNRLIKELPYRYSATLGGFAKVFRSVHHRSGLDAFHLDLCGTLEASIEVFMPIMPLVLRSRGRCLAVTVADQRRNLSQENFSQVEHELKTLLGAINYGKFVERLNVQLGNGQSLSVVRELGFFLHALKLFRVRGGYAWPKTVERFIYISHSRDAAWKMRTYFFHFGETHSGNDQRQARQLCADWMKNPLHDLTIEAAELLTSKETKVMSKDRFPKLASIAATIGGDVQLEFEGIKSELSQLQSTAHSVFDEFRQELLALLERFAGRESVPAKTPTKGRKRGSRKTRRSRVETVKPDQEVHILLSLIKAKAKGGKEYNKAEEKACRELSLMRKPNRCRIVGSKFAHTQKKFRSDFMKRVAAVSPALITEELAGWYSQIEGKEVTADQLRSEANVQ